MAQQASPKVTGQRLLLRPQATSLLRLVNRMPSDSSSCQSVSNRSFMLMMRNLLPSENPLAEDVDVADGEDRHEDQRVREQELRRVPELHGQRVEEGSFQVADEDDHRE